MPNTKGRERGKRIRRERVCRRGLWLAARAHLSRRLAVHAEREYVAARRQARRHLDEVADGNVVPVAHAVLAVGLKRRLARLAVVVAAAAVRSRGPGAWHALAIEEVGLARQAAIERCIRVVWTRDAPRAETADAETAQAGRRHERLRNGEDTTAQHETAIEKCCSLGVFFLFLTHQFDGMGILALVIEIKSEIVSVWATVFTASSLTTSSSAGWCLC